MSTPAYKRVLLKLSGEALMGDDAFGINRQTIERMVADIGDVVALGVELAVVIGGGNIFRGVKASAVHRFVSPMSASTCPSPNLITP